MEAPGELRPIYALAALVSSSSDLVVSALLLKVPHILIARYREINLDLSWKLLPTGLALIVPQNALQAASGGRDQGGTHL